MKDKDALYSAINIGNPIKIDRRIYHYDDNIHWHRHLELLYFLDGQCNVLNGKDEIRVNKGDILVINSNDLHGVKCRKEPAEYICMIIDYAYCESLGFPISNTIFQKAFTDALIADLMEKVLAEKTDTDKYCAEGAKIYTALLLLNLFRNHISENPDSNKKTKITKDVLRFLEENYHEHINLSDLEKSCGYTRYHLSRVFTEIRGKTIMAHLNELRIEKAKQLLLSSPLDINTVAAECGFSTQSYFGKVFKRIVGFTPLEFRGKHEID